MNSASTNPVQPIDFSKWGFPKTISMRVGSHVPSTSIASFTIPTSKIIPPPIPTPRPAPLSPPNPLNPNSRSSVSVNPPPPSGIRHRPPPPPARSAPPNSRSPIAAHSPPQFQSSTSQLQSHSKNIPSVANSAALHRTQSHPTKLSTFHEASVPEDVLAMEFIGKVIDANGQPRGVSREPVFPSEILASLMNTMSNTGFEKVFISETFEWHSEKSTDEGINWQLKKFGSEQSFTDFIANEMDLKSGLSTVQDLIPDDPHLVEKASSTNNLERLQALISKK